MRETQIGNLHLDPGGGGTTIGDVLIASMPTAKVLQNPCLLAHEYQHAKHWAGRGPDFAVAYAGEMLKSHTRLGDYGCANCFKYSANLEWGGYVC